jgi:superfamily II DNA or RNA helicase
MPFDILIIDEAHRSTAAGYETIVSAYPGSAVLGMTATPCRLNGKPLGMFYERMILVAQPSELVSAGWLMEPTVYAPEPPKELADVRIKHGDYETAGLSLALDKPTIVGGIVEHYRKIGPGPRSVVFACNLQHSIHIRDQFRAAGFAAEHIEGDSDPEFRRGAIAALRSGELQILCNCNLLTEGWDLPELNAVILARPTKSLSLYLQMVGRVLRPAPGKSAAWVLDHAGLTLAHGWATSDREWDLDAGEPKEIPQREMKPCPQCALFVPLDAAQCPACDYVWEKAQSPRARQIEHTEGELVKITRSDADRALEDLWTYFNSSMAKGHRVSAAGFPMSAAHRFRERWGRWPNAHEKNKVKRRFQELLARA